MKSDLKRRLTTKIWIAKGSTSAWRLHGALPTCAGGRKSGGEQSRLLLTATGMSLYDLGTAAPSTLLCRVLGLGSDASTTFKRSKLI